MLQEFTTTDEWECTALWSREWLPFQIKLGTSTGYQGEQSQFHRTISNTQKHPEKPVATHFSKTTIPSRIYRVSINGLRRCFFLPKSTQTCFQCQKLGHLAKDCNLQIRHGNEAFTSSQAVSKEDLKQATSSTTDQITSFCNFQEAWLHFYFQFSLHYILIFIRTGAHFLGCNSLTQASRAAAQRRGAGIQLSLEGSAGCDVTTSHTVHSISTGS